MLGGSGRRPFSPALQLQSSPVTTSSSPAAFTTESQTQSPKRRTLVVAEKAGNGKDVVNVKKSKNKENLGGRAMPSPFKHPEQCKPAALPDTNPRKTKSKATKKTKNKAKFYESVMFSSDEELAPDVDADSLLKGLNKLQAKSVSGDDCDGSSSQSTSDSNKSGSAMSDNPGTPGGTVVRANPHGPVSGLTSRSCSKAKQQISSSRTGTAKKVKKVIPAKTSIHQMLDFSSSDSDIDVAVVERPDLLDRLRDTFNQTRVSCSDVSETSSPPRQLVTPMRPIMEAEMVVADTEAMEMVPDFLPAVDELNVVPDSQLGSVPDSPPGSVPDSQPGSVPDSPPGSVPDSQTGSFAMDSTSTSRQDANLLPSAEDGLAQHSVHLNSYSVAYPPLGTKQSQPIEQTKALSKPTPREQMIKSSPTENPKHLTSQSPYRPGTQQAGNKTSKPSCVTPKKQHTPRKAALASPAPQKTPLSVTNPRRPAISSSHNTPTSTQRAATPKSAKATPVSRYNINVGGSASRISTPGRTPTSMRPTPKSVASDLTPSRQSGSKKQTSQSSRFTPRNASDTTSRKSEQHPTPCTPKGTPRSTSAGIPRFGHDTPGAPKTVSQGLKNTPVQGSKESSATGFPTTDSSRKSAMKTVYSYEGKKTPTGSRKTTQKTKNTPHVSRDVTPGPGSVSLKISTPATAEAARRKRSESTEGKTLKSKDVLQSAKKARSGVQSTPARSAKPVRGKTKKFFDAVQFSDEDSGEDIVDGRNLSSSSSSSQASSLMSHSSAADESVSVLSDRLQKILGSKKPRKSHKKPVPRSNENKSSLHMQSDGSLESLNEKLENILGSGKLKKQTKNVTVVSAKPKNLTRNSSFVPDSGGSEESAETKNMSLQVSLASPESDISGVGPGHVGAAGDQTEVVSDSDADKDEEAARARDVDPDEAGLRTVEESEEVIGDDPGEGLEESQEEMTPQACRDISLQVSLMSSPEQESVESYDEVDRMSEKPCDRQYRSKRADCSLNESSESITEDYKSCVAEHTVYTTPPQEQSPSPQESTKINDKLAMCFRDMSLGVSALHTTMDELTSAVPQKDCRTETVARQEVEPELNSSEGTSPGVPRLLLADDSHEDDVFCGPGSADPGTITEHSPLPTLSDASARKACLVSILASPDKKSRRSMNLQVSFYPSEDEDHGENNEDESSRQHDHSLDVDDFINNGSEEPSPLRDPDASPTDPSSQDSEQDGQRQPDSVVTPDWADENLLSGEDKEPIPAPHHKGNESFLMDSSDSDTYNQLLEDRRRSLHIQSRSQQSSSSDSENSPQRPRARATRTAKADQFGEKSPAKSARAHYSESSDEELETFFANMRKPKKKPEKDTNKSLRDFIVDSEESSPDSSDDEVFHLRTTQMLSRPSRMRPPRRVSACHELVLGGSEDEEEDEDEAPASPSEEDSDSDAEENEQPDTAENSEEDAASNNDDDYDVTRDYRPSDDSDDDDIFLPPKFTPRRTPGHRPPTSSASNTPYVTPHPKEVLGTRKTQTPLRSRAPAQAAAGNDMRSHSTGHLPVFAGFLKSLTCDLPADTRHPEAEKFIKYFKKNKADLVKKLFVLYNESVFNKKLPLDMSITWNSRLLKTAGFCAYKRNPREGEARNARIELSVKVCDSAERVRDTLIHELCHAAVWLNHGVNGGHGPFWRSYAAKAMKVHQDLPPISRCHTYEINYKFTYRCTKCGYKIGRHSKSLDMDTKVCGYCHAPFELLHGTPAHATKPVAARTPRTPSRFALFVKENYGNVKQSTPGIKHGDVMRQLSKDFAEKNKISS